MSCCHAWSTGAFTFALQSGAYIGTCGKGRNSAPDALDPKAKSRNGNEADTICHDSLHHPEAANRTVGSTFYVPVVFNTPLALVW